MRSTTAALLALCGHDPAAAQALQHLFRPAPHPWPSHIPAAERAAWTLPLDDLARWLAVDGRLAALVPARAERWPVVRQVAHVGGRLCAERALAALQGQASPALFHGHGLARRPDGSPHWPAGWTGSITHGPRSASAAVCATRWAGGLGIDSEEIPAPDIAADVAAVCCTARERLELTRSGALDPVQLAISFAAKEAYYKAVAPRVGRYVEFDEVEVTVIDPARRHCTVVVNGDRPDLQVLAPTAEARWAEVDGAVHLLLATR